MVYHDLLIQGRNAVLCLATDLCHFSLGWTIEDDRGSDPGHDDLFIQGRKSGMLCSAGYMTTLAVSY